MHLFSTCYSISFHGRVWEKRPLLQMTQSNLRNCGLGWRNKWKISELFFFLGGHVNGWHSCSILIYVFEMNVCKYRLRASWLKFESKANIPKGKWPVFSLSRDWNIESARIHHTPGKALHPERVEPALQKRQQYPSLDLYVQMFQPNQTLIIKHKQN